MSPKLAEVCKRTSVHLSGHCHLPRDFSDPYEIISQVMAPLLHLITAVERLRLTSVDLVVDICPRDSTLLGLVGSLDFQRGADVTIAARIHGALEGVALPAEHVVAVLRVSMASRLCWSAVTVTEGEVYSRIVCTPDERLFAIHVP